MGESSYAELLLFYGAVSDRTEKVVEFFLEREDEAVLAEDLRIESVELG